MTEIIATPTTQTKITLLEKSAWIKLVSGIRKIIAGNIRITNAEIEKSIVANNPNYASKLIDLAANTARNFHQSYLEYLAVMQPLSYGNEAMEASILEYLTGSLQIKSTIAKAAILEARAELKKMAFAMMEKTAKNEVKPEDVHTKPTKIAARIKDDHYDGDLTESLFGMLVVATDAQQKILWQDWQKKYREEQRLRSEQSAADEKARKERATVTATARANEDEAKAIAKAKKDAERAQRLNEVLRRPRVKFTIAGRIFFAFNVNQEEAFLLDDGTFCVNDGAFFRVNKNPKNGRTSTTTLVGAEFVVDRKEESSNINDSLTMPSAFSPEKAQSIWVVYEDLSGREQTVKAMVIPSKHFVNLTINDDDSGILIINDENGGPLYRKTASTEFQIGTCRLATRREKTAIKGQKMSMAA